VTEAEKAQHVLHALKSAETAAPETALSILNGLIGLVRGGGDGQSLEVDEARSSAFLSICEAGKALHQGQPLGQHWTTAIAATERWIALAK
jgi:hypothetical protein